MPWTMVTPATAEPIDLALVKQHCRVDTDVDDPLLAEIYIPAAREHLEFYTRRQWMTATLAYSAPCFPQGDTIVLPRPPLQAVTLLAYYDSANVLQTWASSNYVVDTANEPGGLVRIPSVSWPSTFERPNAVVVTYTAGWASTALVPSGLRQAMLLLIGYMYEQREDSVEKALSCIPFGVHALAGMHRLVEV